jgi:hypothetical protein
MQDTLVQTAATPKSCAARGFSAFKTRLTADQEKDGFVHGLQLMDLMDQSRFPLGKQVDEKGEFVWGCEFNDGEEA